VLDVGTDNEALQSDSLYVVSLDSIPLTVYPAPSDTSTQGWSHERIRGDAYDRFTDKYVIFLFVLSFRDDYPLNLLGLFNWSGNIYPIPCCTSRISE
jgi:hypothetical protein